MTEALRTAMTRKVTVSIGSARDDLAEVKVGVEHLQADVAVLRETVRELAQAIDTMTRPVKLHPDTAEALLVTEYLARDILALEGE